MAAKVAVCLPKPGVPPHRNLGTYWYGSMNAKNARKMVRAKSLLMVFLTLQHWLLVSLHLVCPPESAHSRGGRVLIPRVSRGGGVLIQRLSRAKHVSRTEFSTLCTPWHNHSTQNPLEASDWLTNWVMGGHFLSSNCHFMLCRGHFAFYPIKHTCFIYKHM